MVIMIHSLLRWLIVIFLLIATVKSLMGWLGKKEYTKADNLTSLFLLIFTHTQLLIGLFVYMITGRIGAGIDMAKADQRFWTVEHGAMMILAIVLITLGRILSKKVSGVAKHKRGTIFFGIAILLVLWAGVINPYLLGSGWF